MTGYIHSKIMSLAHWPSTMRDPSRTSSKYSSGVRCSLPTGGPSVTSLTAFIFAHYTLTRAKAIRAPSMQTDHFMASSRLQASTSRFTSPKWLLGMASTGHRRIIKSCMANPATLGSSVSYFS